MPVSSRRTAAINNAARHRRSPPSFTPHHHTHTHTARSRQPLASYQPAAGERYGGVARSGVVGGGGVVRGDGGGGDADAGGGGAERAAEQVPAGLHEADGLHGLRDGARGRAVVDVLRRHVGDAAGAARVPVLHHPAGAQRPERGAVARPPLRPPPRHARRLQAPQRQRLPLHQPAALDPKLTGLCSLRQRLQGGYDAVKHHPWGGGGHRRRLQGSGGAQLRRRRGSGGFCRLLVHLLIHQTS